MFRRPAASQKLRLQTLWPVWITRLLYDNFIREMSVLIYGDVFITGMWPYRSLFDAMVDIKRMHRPVDRPDNVQSLNGLTGVQTGQFPTHVSSDSIMRPTMLFIRVQLIHRPDFTILFIVWTCPFITISPKRAFISSRRTVLLESPTARTALFQS